MAKTYKTVSRVSILIPLTIVTDDSSLIRADYKESDAGGGEKSPNKYREHKRFDFRLSAEPSKDIYDISTLGSLNSRRRIDDCKCYLSRYQKHIKRESNKREFLIRLRRNPLVDSSRSDMGDKKKMHTSERPLSPSLRKE